jgi:regulatory protein
VTSIEASLFDGSPHADAAHQRALDHAYGYLACRDRTVGEMRRHLAAKGVEAATVDSAVETLLQQGYLDDPRFVRVYSHDKRELEQWGAERIRRGLLARGIEPELLDQLPGEQPETSELDRAVALLVRRFPSPPRERRERDRALGMLMRKGYEPRLALEALNAYARRE